MSPRAASKVAAARWEIAPGRPEEAGALADALGASPLVAQVILNRGISDAEEARRFLDPRLKDLGDPFALPGMDAAVTRLARAVERRESVVIYGDYDVDGVSSVTLAVRLLRALGLAEARPFLPDRFDEGYGLGEASLQRCLAEGKPDLMLVLDCGTNSVAEVASLRAAGVDVVILDHHEPTRPANAHALVNYKLRSGRREAECPEEKPTEFCTAGLMFKCAHGLLKRLREIGHDPARQFDLKEALDLVALATVADLAPLAGENRILVRHGLRQMAAARQAGLRALMEVARVEGTPTTTDCGFRLGPRLNAAGRIESATAALRLLLTEDAAEAAELAARLDATNRERQAEDQRVYAEARADAETQFQEPATRALVVARPGWHEGVAGIVAARLAREFHLPAFVVALGEKSVAKGSGRGIEGFDLSEAVNATRAHLAGGGGHAMAAGVSLRPDCLAAWREALQEFARTHPLFRDGRPRRSVRADAEVRLADVTLGLISALEAIEPCGFGNPRPVLVARGVEVADDPRAVGRDGAHLQLRLKQGETTLAGIAFGHGNAPVKKGDRLDLLFEPQRNEYRGRVSAQIQVLELSRSATADRE
ncbi:MAG: single-stranded-DNA-specific exonuclease RecJ [Verrucomicrobiae bacterium]|nr:single-stranded-DNA-specific exonuclease RecJ [Verrucomicrobiae bacterium]